MSEQPNSGELHRADPAYRRQMQVFLAVTIVGGFVLLGALYFWLGRMNASAAQGDLLGYEHWLHWLLGGLCLVLGAAAGAFAQWLHRMAKASKGERRWPPSSMRTSADVRVRYLTSADSLVAQLKAGALGLFFLAAGLIAWGVWLLVSR